MERDSFKFGNWFRRKATGAVPKLNGCRHSLPPHAQWAVSDRFHFGALTLSARPFDFSSFSSAT